MKAFVLSGGASMGAAQVGMLLALDDAGITPDVILGTSVGALNGAWVAGGTSLYALADVWRSLRREDVFPTRYGLGLAGFLGKRDHLVPHTGLRRLLEAHLAYARFEDARIPLHVIATDLASGDDVRLSSGDVVPAVLASAAIPGVFPPVTIGGQRLIDGGVVDNTPISHAVDLGADTVYVLPAAHRNAAAQRPRTALGVALQALNLVVNARLALDIDRYEEAVDLQVVPPVEVDRSSPADFSHAGALIDAALESTRDWLATPTIPGQSCLLRAART